MMDKQQTLRCLVVDDEPLALALLSDYIAKMPGLELLKATSDEVTGLAEATSGRVDLIFLDMQMPELNGLQFMKVLQQRCMVIVTTAYGEYALDGYEYNVVDYLLKPIAFDRFIIAVEKALERDRYYELSKQIPAQSNDSSNAIFIKMEHRQVRVELADIIYLEGARDYIVIHTLKKQLLTLESLKSLEERLPIDKFMRIHKSYIVALDRIDFVERNRVSVGGKLLPVSDSCKIGFERFITSRLPKNGG